jgi:hypothetical protein
VTDYSNRVLALNEGTHVTFGADGTLSVTSVEIDRPRIAIRRTGGEIVLSWPKDSNDILESTSVLSPTPNWKPASGPFITTTDTVEYHIASVSQSAAQFYRLRR